MILMTERFQTLIQFAYHKSKYFLTPALSHRANFQSTALQIGFKTHSTAGEYRAHYRCGISVLDTVQNTNISITW